MNRFAPLIVRHGHVAARPSAAAAALAVNHGRSELIDDLKFFALVWAGGFVFFGTLFA